MIDRINTFLNSLERRERFILVAGLVITVVTVGIFFITIPLYEKNKKLEKQLKKELENYRELVKLASEYASIRPNVVRQGSISLSEIESISSKLGLKSSITSIKPITFEGEDSVEIMMKDAPADSVINFLMEVEKKGYRIKFISMYDPKGNRKLTVRIVIGA